MTSPEARRDQGAEAKRSLVDQIIAKKTEKFAEHPVYLDGQAWSEAEAIRERIGEARRQEIMDTGTDALAFPLHSVIPGLERQLMELLVTLEASEVLFRFKALRDDEYDALLNAHPNPDPDLLWDDDFPVALIASTCIKVEGPDIAYDEVTVDEVEALRSVFDRAQFAGLFRATNDLQKKAPAPFTYAATAKTRGSEQSLTSVSDSEESPTPGS